MQTSSVYVMILWLVVWKSRILGCGFNFGSVPPTVHSFDSGAEMVCRDGLPRCINVCVAMRYCVVLESSRHSIHRCVRGHLKSLGVQAGNASSTRLQCLL